MNICHKFKIDRTLSTQVIHVTIIYSFVRLKTKCRVSNYQVCFAIALLSCFGQMFVNFVLHTLLICQRHRHRHRLTHRRLVVGSVNKTPGSSSAAVLWPKPKPKQLAS